MLAGLTLLASLALIPQPQKVTELAGSVPDTTKIEYVNAAVHAGANGKDESYRLRVADGRVVVTSASDTGRFYALKTLEQLREGKSWKCAEIEDWPVFGWRGVLLDEGRHFFGKETVRRMLELMADYKFNVLHWHLTEDQGWRIDIPGMPELVKYGSVRPDSLAHGARLHMLDRTNFVYTATAMAGEKYGPFYYTEADLREIVAYAAERHITIVPEVDMPGHMMALLAAYPQLCCFPDHIKVRQAGCYWGVQRDVLCVGNDETLATLEKIFDFICDVFPSSVIHLGGDECPRLNWKACSKCQARMKAEGLKSEDDLQGWITAQVIKMLAKRGRRAMGWDEILSGDIPKTAIGQSWRMNNKDGAGAEAIKGYVSAADAAERGFDIVMSPWKFTYLSLNPGVKEDPFLRAGVDLTLEKTYQFDPLAGVSKKARPHILGGQCCLWSEYIWHRYDLEWRMWPRAFAIAEILWTNPAKRDFKEFAARAAFHRSHLVQHGVNASPMK